MNRNAGYKSIAKDPVGVRDSVLLEMVIEEEPWESLRVRVMKMLAVAMMKRTRGNQCVAARRLGMHRNTLTRILSRK